MRALLSGVLELLRDIRYRMPAKDEQGDKADDGEDHAGDL